ncbi:MAG: response regulator [Pseudoflavonifractor sp.]
MKVILVDSDASGLQGFATECENMAGIHLAGSFTSSGAALEYAKTHLVDLAVLDIKMPEMDGLALCDRLRELRPGMIIAFVTAYADCAIEAIRKQGDCIVFKPYQRAEVENALCRARRLQGRLKERVYCQTFGRFDVFVDGVPMMFKSAKAKEILALCVYRQGAPVSAEEIIEKVWEDYRGPVGKCSAFRFTIKQLVDTLKQYNAQEIFGREKGICYINRHKVSCDYFDFLSDDDEAICEFQDEFMEEYTWAEAGLYALHEKKALALDTLEKRKPIL